MLSTEGTTSISLKQCCMSLKLKRQKSTLVDVFIYCFKKYLNEGNAINRRSVINIADNGTSRNKIRRPVMGLFSFLYEMFYQK